MFGIQNIWHKVKGYYVPVLNYEEYEELSNYDDETGYVTSTEE